MAASKAASLDTKLTQLRIAVEKTNAVIDSSKREAIERQYAGLKAITAEVDHMRIGEEARKIEAKEELSDIQTWNADVDARLAEADNEVERLRKWLEDRKREAEMFAREEQMTFEAKLHETRMKFQTELKTVKGNALQEESPKTTTAPEKSLMARLPKLVISKFSGNYQDWQRFWGQFTETIDKTSIAPITKFTYLCELLDPKIKHVVDSLPFTPEGYNRAKTVLEERYGKESEIIKSYIKEIMELPRISNANPKKIGEFSERLNHCVQALQTMNKLSQVNGNVSMTLDKLPAIRGDLVRTDPEWESWTFAQLSEAIRLWSRRNPTDIEREEQPAFQRRERPARMYHARREDSPRDSKPRGCVYCGDQSHKATECTKITRVTERKQILMKKRLCFNCALGSHRAADCSSKTSCYQCHKRHHTSICEIGDARDESGHASKEVALTTNQTGEGVFPVIVIKINGMKCRALIDSGAGSSYISAKLVSLLRVKPVETQTKQVDMLMCSKQVRMEAYQLTVESVDSNHEMDVKFIKVNKAELLSVENPHYEDLIRSHAHLKGVKIADSDRKSQLPIHAVFGSGEYARIKTETKPQIGNDGEPVAELTKMGWFIMSPGTEFDRNTMLLTQTSQSDYEGLCRMDVLGLEDSSEHDQGIVHAEFKEQVRRADEGWYETGLPWRGNHPELPNNKQGSLQRLDKLTKRLQRNGQHSAYNDIIQEQIRDGIVEKAPVQVTGREFYIPHKAVVREESTTTKMRIVYDASARASSTAPSLNECLYPGPPLQNRLWDVLVRQRAYPVALTGDIRKAFLQIRIREPDRDALRFHWRSSEEAEIETLRFTRALFGLAPSPFLLNGVLEAQLDAWEKRHPDFVAELRKSLYVDDLLTGGQTVKQAQRRKQVATEILGDATFELHKWNSNDRQLEGGDELGSEGNEQTHAKQQLNVQPAESKMLGLKWNKQQDTLAVTFPSNEAPPTKRGILSKLAAIYDPLGLVSPTTLEGKLIYRDVCNSKKQWDARIDETHLQRWQKWQQSLPKEQCVPRPIVDYREEIESVELHAFGDASETGVGTAVYAVVRQQSGTTHRLVAAKSRLAKKGLTIPRLELISAHMATNLVTNVLNALDNLPTTKVFAWLDSTVALHWIKGDGKYKQFVENRVTKIQLHKSIEWRHVPTRENPADLASRGGSTQSQSLWYEGPEWLPHPHRWPENIVTKPSPVTEAEAKVVREVLSLTQATPIVDGFDKLLEKWGLSRAMKIGAWALRFVHNTRNSLDKRGGPITTQELENVHTLWIKRAQSSGELHKERLQLNLQPNEQGVLECRGRIQGEYPICLPDKHLYAQKLVEQAHLQTLHGGVGLTMARVRERHWIPRLRSLAKRVIRSCYGCKRFQATAFETPPPGKLPTDRTCEGYPFRVIGVDFAGPLTYRLKTKREAKAYVVLYTCSLTRAIHLELTHSLETKEFLRTLKELIARRGRPHKIYSDNGRTFVGAARWLKTVMQDEAVQNLLAANHTKWQFNLSRAPWWGGQFERMVALVKNALNKCMGNGCLKWDELKDVLLDIEVALNNRPLCYIEEDVQLPTLTPNLLIHPQSNILPEIEPHHITDVDLRRRAKYLRRVKTILWDRWTREYLRGLRERHNLKNGGKSSVAVGDVVLIKAEEKNRGKWPIGIVEELYPGRDGVVRAVKLRAGKSYLERAVQHLYPLELSCDRSAPASTDLNPAAPVFRPLRSAALKAREQIRQLNES